MTCPCCGAPMNAEVLDTHLAGSVTIDVCLPCQLFWFDTHESLQLAPRSVLKLFGIIGDRTAATRADAVGHPACPRCGIRLLEIHDQQRQTHFQYLRCPKDHGRLITFVNFLREKNFIRPLSAGEIENLRRNVQVVNCSNCGAPIDLAHASSCAHCGSPISMLDMKQAGALVATLHEADQPKPLDPALPLRLAQARREVETAFAGFEGRPGWFDDVSRGGLVAAGLTALAAWLKERR